MSLPECERLYSAEDVANLLQKAKQLGFTLEAGSILEGLTVYELEKLVNTRH